MSILQLIVAVSDSPAGPVVLKSLFQWRMFLVVPFRPVSAIASTEVSSPCSFPSHGCCHGCHLAVGQLFCTIAGHVPTSLDWAQIANFASALLSFARARVGIISQDYKNRAHL